MKFPLNFIKATEEFNTLEKYVPAPLMRRSFAVKETPNTATLLITGKGHY